MLETTEPKEKKVTLSGCYNCIKVSLIVFNVILWILGWLIFGLGVAGVSNSDFNLHVGYSYPHLHTAAILFIILGLFIVALGFFGCFGAFRESKVALGIYYVVLLLILLLLMFSAQWAIANQSLVQVSLHGYLPDRIRKYSSEPQFMDSLQKWLECCGDQSAHDYPNGPPASCGESVQERFQRKGCHPKMMEFAQNHMVKFITGGIIVAIIMVIGLAFAMTMCFALNEVGR